MSNVVVGEVIIRTRFDSGKAKPEAKKLEGSVKNLTKSARNLGTGFERMGRTISITGFVLGIVARRVVQSFQGIAQSIMKISEEGANLNKALEYVGTALEALALSGMLTDETLARILATFNDMFDIALKSAGPWAIINDAIQQLKNAIALGALPSLEALAEFLLGFDLEPFKQALSEATNTFLIPLIAKIKELLGEEGGGLIGISEKMNAIALIGGSFLAGVLEGFDQILIKAAELIGNDQTGITGLASKMGEFAAWATVLAPAGAIIGMIVGGFGSIIRVISSLIALIGTPATGGLLLVLGTVLADFDGWQRSIGRLVVAIDNLSKELGIDLVGAIGSVNQTLEIFSIIIRTPINLITRFLEMITAVIRKIKELSSMLTSMPETYGTGGLNRGGFMEHQHGTRYVTRTGLSMLHKGEQVIPRNQVSHNYGGIIINVNGAGDPRSVAEEVSRILSQQSRKAWMPI